MNRNEEIALAYRAFEECGSVVEAKRQLNEGYMMAIDFSRYVLEVWDNFRRLPQYEHLKM